MQAWQLHATGGWRLGGSEKASEDGQFQIMPLKRKTKFSRFAAGGEVKEQIVAANVDTVFLMQSLNRVLI